MDRETKDIFNYRKWVYYFLSSNFIEEADFKEIGSKDNLDLLTLISKEELASYLRNDRDDLGEERFRMFSSFGRIPVSPWRSSYVNPEAIIFDENMLEVRDFYRSWGLRHHREKIEPDDHIGSLLEFMGVLIEKSFDEDLLNKSLRDQAYFLRYYILDWFEGFMEVLLKETRSDYYRILIKEAYEFLKEDLEYLNTF